MKISVKLVLCISLLVGTLGCSSWIERSKKLIDDEEAKQAKNHGKTQSKWVNRKDYENLNLKYKNLSDKYEILLKSKVDPKTSFDQIDELAKKTPIVNLPSGSKIETVDVFGKGGLVTEVEKLSVQTETSSIERELKTYKKALSLKEAGKTDEALRVFQFLEKSMFEQVQVRARMEIGLIYLEKNQYDLSLQVFEKVIGSNAFSGKILDALRGAFKSAEGLGLTDKKLRYQSMLRDFFGVRS